MELRLRTHVGLLLLLLPVGVRGQGRSLPSGFSEKAKDLFAELKATEADSPKNYLSAETCEQRAQLLKALATSTAKEANQVKSMVIFDLGLCELHNDAYVPAKKRFESAISELNAPSEDMLMQNTQMAPYVLLKEAMVHLTKDEPSRAGISLRRCKAVFKKEINNLHKEVSKGGKIPIQSVPEVIKEWAGKSKGELGQNADYVGQILGANNKIDAATGLLDKIIANTLKIVTAEDKEEKEKQGRIQRSLAGPFLPLIAMKPVVETDKLLYAKKLEEDIESFKEESEKGVDKSVVLYKRSKIGSGCKTYIESCKTLADINDITTNGFGETRILVLKPGKKTSLDTCETNGNIGILMPVKVNDGSVSMTIGAETKELQLGKAVAVDFCLAGELTAPEGAHVLFAQVWHPQVSALERTTEIRDRGKKWKLSDDEVKAVTKSVNAHAKKDWDKTQKEWAKSSAAEAMNEKFKNVAQAKRAEELRAANDAKQAELDADEDRKKGLEELEKKRAEKKRLETEREKKRVERNDKRAEEEMKKDPWLRDPVVLAAKAKLEELKEGRRDANAKLEFDLTTQLTKDITAQERLVKKLIKKAKKAYKKGKSLKDEGYNLEGVKVAGGAEGASDEDEDAGAADSSSGGDGDVKALEAKLKEVDEQKEKAIADENFKKAGDLKKEKAKLEEQLKQAKAKKGGSKEEAALQKKLTKIEADKAKAIEKEDFKKASELKKEKEEIEKKLKSLKEEL